MYYNVGWTEFVYLTLSLSSKTSVFWLSFSGIKLMINFLQNWGAVQLAAELAPALGALAALAAGTVLLPALRPAVAASVI